MTPAAFRKLALSLPGAEEQPHFHRTSFRVRKKIFATMTPDGAEAMVRVRPFEKAQALIEAEPGVFFSYGYWTARDGALGVRLAAVDRALLRELLTESWAGTAPPSLRARRR